MGEVKTVREIHQQHKWWSFHVAHNSLEQTNSLVFFSLHWEKWIWLRKGFFTRWPGLIWAVVRDQNYQKNIRNTLGCLATTDQWTKDWDVGVTIFLLSLPSHTDSFWHHPPALGVYVSLETTKSKCLLRLEEIFILLRKMKILLWTKRGAKFSPLFS